MADMPAHCSVTVKSESSEFEGVCAPILQKLKDNGYTEDDIFAVHLAVEEAFHNAVDHGNGGDSSKKVQVEHCIDAEKVEIKITDEGYGFNPNDVPDPRVGDNLYRPNGRGLLLITAYMDDVQYNDRGNCITMLRRRERPETTDQDA